ncbi:hypothetical protein LBMAG53_08100 [Planctomycetota bacterium]|nr:hypothetical protein LBMAG53_08100 [Planctomycetota bacterium]
MDIYFCDSCGVRVNHADLSSGRGVRRRHQVVCADCVAKGVKIGEPGGAAARVPQVPSESSQHDTARLRQAQPSLAEAVSGFSALAGSSQPKARDDRHDDLSDHEGADPLSDHDDDPDSDHDEGPDSDENKGPALEPARNKSGTPRPASKNPEKAETADVVKTQDRAATVKNDEPSVNPLQKPGRPEKADTAESEPVPVASRRTSSSRTPNPSRSSKEAPRKAGTSTTKGTRPPTGARKLRPADRAMVIVTAIAFVAALAGAGYLLYFASQRPPKPDDITIDHTKDLDSVIAASRAEVDAVMAKTFDNSASLAEVDSAIVAIGKVRTALEKFEREAKSQGLDDEAIARITQGKHLSDFFAKRINLNQARAKLMANNRQ